MRPLALFLSLALLAGCGGGSSPSPSGAAAPTSPAVTPASPGSPTNDALLTAASPFEDLAEAGDQAGMDRAIAAYHREAASLHDLLGPQDLQRLDELTSEIEEARASGDDHTVAVSAVEAYRVLIGALDREGLVVPAEVSLLDYAGFKLGVQARAAEPDWAAMTRTVGEAEGWWATIDGDVTETGLRDAVDTAVRGMRQAVEAKDTEWAGFAAQVDLDLVDLLEHYFEGGTRG